MSATSHFVDELNLVLDQRGSDSLMFVDQVLEFCTSKGVQIRWDAESCRILPLAGDEEILHWQLRASQFRAMLARIAALCQGGANAISPYGGEGTIVVASNPKAAIRVSMANRPDAQWVHLTPVAGIEGERE